MHNYTRVILTVLATARLSRFLTDDWLGHWWIVQPARDWALARQWASGHPPPDWEDRDESNPRVRLVMGLDCPFCVGFWIGGAVLLAQIVCPRPLRPALNFALTTLSLNYVVGHISSRLDH